MSSSFARQFPRNLLANFVYFFANIAIGVLLVPFFISNLGVAAYGLIPVATSIAGYVAIFVQCLNMSVSRFLTIDLHSENYAAANRTFNTALFGLSAVMLMMLPVVFALTFFAPSFFNVPLKQEIEVTYLFLGVIAAFLIRSWSGNFSVLLFAHNRIDLLSHVNTFNVVFQLLLLLIFFSLFDPSLTQIGLAYLISGTTSSALAIKLSRWINPNLSINWHDFDRSHLYDILVVSWWMIFGSVGALLLSNIDLIIVNKLFGATAGGQYAIVLQWSTLIKAISATFSGILAPVILGYYAKNQFEELIRTAGTSIKFMGLALALPIGLVCGFSPVLLTIWVGAEFSFLAPLMVILVGPLTINLSVTPLFSINLAYKRVGIPGLVTLLMGIGNLILAVVLALHTNLGLYGVAIAAGIFTTLKHAVFTPLYASHILDVKVHSFIREIVPGALSSIIIAGSAAAISNFVFISNFTSLAIACCFLTFIYVLICWSLGLDRSQRIMFLSYIRATMLKSHR